MPGPRPKPTALRRIDGSAKYNKSRTNPDEPQPSSALGDPPDRLSARAMELWQSAPYWLAAEDRHTWASYCAAQADAERWRSHCELEGWWTDGSRGTPVIHPAARLYKENSNRADKLAVEMGLTPSSRTRVKVPARPLDPANDPLRGL